MQPPSEEEAPVAEEAQSGFTTSFAPPPPDVVQTGESQARPDDAPTYTGETNIRVSLGSQPVSYTSATAATVIETRVTSQDVKALKLLGPVGAYPTGSIVPANMFDDVDRLIRLGVAEYTTERAVVSQPDPDMLTAMRLAQPLSVHRSGIPQAPWVQSSVYDIIGPAVARSGQPPTGPKVLAAPEGYKAMAGEFGQTLIVAQPVDKTQPREDKVESPNETEE